MLKRLLNFILLSQGISSTDEKEPEDKWAEFREEREAWEHEQNLKNASPAGDDKRDGQAPKPE